MGLRIVVLSAVLAGAVYACSNAIDAVKTQNIEVVERQHAELWSEGKLDLIPTDYSVDFTGHFPAGIVHGHAGLRARVEAHRTAFPDWTEVVDDVIADGDRVVTRITSRGTNMGEFLGGLASGKHVEISEACIFRLEDGKIVEQWVYPDFRSMQSQLGPDQP
jgi:steroid delta-isomerase-like uncharacterized protein